MAIGLVLLPAGLLLAGLASRRGRPAATRSPAPPAAFGPPIPAALGGYWHELAPSPNGTFVVPYGQLFAVSAPADSPQTPLLIRDLQALAGTGQLWQLETYPPGATLPREWPSSLDPPTAAPAFRARAVVSASAGQLLSPGVYASQPGIRQPVTFRTFVWSVT
jgi:hypothetical protein